MPLLKKGPPKRTLTPPTAIPEDAPAAEAAPKKLKKIKAAPVPAPAEPTKVSSKRGRPSTTKPATENKVPKISKLKNRACNDDQLFIWSIVHALKVTAPTNAGKRIELRYVDDRAAVLFHEQAGVPCRSCYTQPEETKKILAFVKKWVPQEVMPTKWDRRVNAAPDAEKGDE